MTPPNPTSQVRLAVDEDVDRVTTLFLEAMRDDPAWPYRFPYCEDHLDDHWKYNRDLMRRFISQEYKDWCVVVVEVEVLDDTHASIIVAFSVWDITYVNKRVRSDYTPKSRQCILLLKPRHDNLTIFTHPAPKDTADRRHTQRDANPKHLAAFQAAIEGAKTYFDKFGIDQLRLQILGVHREYRRRGFGKLLCQWGMKRADEDEVTIVLTASPDGYKLYNSLGFETLGKQVIKAPGEEESLVMTCMALRPKSQQPGP